MHTSSKQPRLTEGQPSLGRWPPGGPSVPHEHVVSDGCAVRLSAIPSSSAAAAAAHFAVFLGRVDFRGTSTPDGRSCTTATDHKQRARAPYRVSEAGKGSLVRFLIHAVRENHPDRWIW